MGRLTGKNKVGRYGFITENNTLCIFDKNSLADKCYTKLGQLEDIEEELGIDLIKAVELCKQVNNKKVVYTKENWGIVPLKILDELELELFSHRLYVNTRGMYVSLDLYEYKKTWALTKEELENE